MRVSGSKMRILLIGKDARTDAIAAACIAGSEQPELYAFAEYPTPGLAAKCEQRIFTGRLTDVPELIRIAREVRPELAIIGPEEPLEAGCVDALGSLGIPAFGPSKRLAHIESSKAWARQLLDSHQIPGNPEYRVFASADGLKLYMQELGSFVIKPDGLTAGKGVRVSGEHFSSIEEALAYAEALLAKDGRVQVEQRLEGEEFSLQTITDGESVIHCPLVQDHKRAFAGDLGPNTGGMGSYSCPDFSLPFLDQGDVRKAQSINEQVIDALARDTGEPYRGVLYGGFMATGDGVRLIEYNSRFGDPEALNVLPILRADFSEVCLAAARGQLGRVSCSFQRKATVCKYLVPLSYPEPSDSSAEIDVPDRYLDAPDLKWYWAACEQHQHHVRLTQSRAGAFVGIGESLKQAEVVAERAAGELERTCPVRHRADIGRGEVVAARVRRMKSLRSGAPAPEGRLAAVPALLDG
jgi:phosphoribosylamine---glycine ligase